MKKNFLFSKTELSQKQIIDIATKNICKAKRLYKYGLIEASTLISCNSFFLSIRDYLNTVNSSIDFEEDNNFDLEISISIADYKKGLDYISHPYSLKSQPLLVLKPTNSYKFIVAKAPRFLEKSLVPKDIEFAFYKMEALFSKINTDEMILPEIRDLIEFKKFVYFHGRNFDDQLDGVCNYMLIKDIPQLDLIIINIDNCIHVFSPLFTQL